MSILGLLYALLQALGLLAAGKAVVEARTAQGATAWAVALVAFPLLAVEFNQKCEPCQQRMRAYMEPRLPIRHRYDSGYGP